MRRYAIKSKIISSVRYSRISGELTLNFANGKAYRYSRVPHSVVQSLLKSASPGSFFIEQIRDQYRRREVR
ncbi:KTSC domain-containing protein [Hartmannibacter diazotrophicus]|uniref:KTSC domain-containing protein n=1 Tax=Hartmannibacter diazotrophicus TaxID=1482074 RepID=UPI0012FDE85D|nr:KTSC domain-containing protein [Hartmannibacter diazotrophicus]